LPWRPERCLLALVGGVHADSCLQGRRATSCPPTTAGRAARRCTPPCHRDVNLDSLAQVHYAATQQDRRDWIRKPPCLSSRGCSALPWHSFPRWVSRPSRAPAMEGVRVSQAALASLESRRDSQTSSAPKHALLGGWSCCCAQRKQLGMCLSAPERSAHGSRSTRFMPQLWKQYDLLFTQRLSVTAVQK